MALFGCLWIADFPVWAALRARPIWRGQPLVVHRDGRIVALSKEARERGIDPEWTTSHARSQVPQLLSLPLDAAANARTWEQVLTALYELTPHAEAVREGCCFFEMPAGQQKQRALARLVFQYHARCGVAAHRAVAELAAYEALAREVRGVRAGHEAEFVEGVPLETLSQAGVAKATLQQLQGFGLRWLGQLRGLNRAQIHDLFEDGALLWRFMQATEEDSAPIALYTAAAPLSEREATTDEVVSQATAKSDAQSTLSVSIPVELSVERPMSRSLLHKPALLSGMLLEPMQWWEPISAPMSLQHRMM